VRQNCTDHAEKKDRNSVEHDKSVGYKATKIPSWHGRVDLATYESNEMDPPLCGLALMSQNG
jgi:hypothetical protein